MTALFVFPTKPDNKNYKYYNNPRKVLEISDDEVMALSGTANGSYYIIRYDKEWDNLTDAEWLKRVGSWSDKIKFELGLVDKLGVAPKYPSTTEEIDALATKAKKMYEYYTDPKRANDRNCELRARALKKIINDCEDRLTNPMPYVEKQNTLANNEYDKRTTNLRTGDKQKQLRTYAFPKDKTQQPYVEPDEKSALIDVDKKTMFPHNFDEMQEQKSIHINPENKGKFNATKQRTGKSTEELTHSKNPITRKRAVFAQNVKRWNKK